MHRYDAHKCQCLLSDGIITVLLYISLYRTANKKSNVANVYHNIMACRINMFATEKTKTEFFWVLDIVCHWKNMKCT